MNDGDDFLALVIAAVLLSMAWGALTGLGVVALVYFLKDRRGC